MTLLEQARKDLTVSMKARDKERTDALRLLVAALLNEATSLHPADDLSVVRRMIAQSQEAEEAFRKGGAEDRADAERVQADIYKTYLPTQLNEEEFDALIDRAIRESGATTMKQMGQAMKIAQSLADGKAENSKIAEAVKRRLSGTSTD